MIGTCPSCGGKTFLDISEIEGSEEGYVITGRINCNKCGQFFTIAREIKVELEQLECPSCHKTDFDLNYKVIKKYDGGFEFSALMQCKNQACNWKKDIKSGIKHISNAFGSIESIAVSPDGFTLTIKK